MVWRTVVDREEATKYSVGRMRLALSHKWGQRWGSVGADGDGTVAVRTGVLSWISGGADSGGCVPTKQMQCGTTAPCTLPPVGTQMGQRRCGQRWDSGGTDRGAQLAQWRRGPWRKYHVMHTTAQSNNKRETRNNYNQLTSDNTNRKI